MRLKNKIYVNTLFKDTWRYIVMFWNKLIKVIDENFLLLHMHIFKFIKKMEFDGIEKKTYFLC